MHNLRILVGGLAAITLFACNDRSAPPPRSSPEPEEGGSLGASIVHVDVMRVEPTWYDPDAQRVFRLRGGTVEPVQERVLSEVAQDGLWPEVLRVFDDGSIAIVAGGNLYLYPIDGELTVEDLAASDVVVDGASIDDLWYTAWFVDDRGYRLCHRTGEETDCSVEPPNVGGYSAQLAVAADGSVYVTDRDVAIHRLHDGALEEVGSVPGGVGSFRRDGDSVLALANPGLFALEGASLRMLDERYVAEVVGSADDYYAVHYDSELVKVDPSCEDTFITSCDRRTLWSQLVLEHVSAAGTSEVGHESCDDTRPAICERTLFGLGIDGERLVLIGDPLRTVAR